MYTYIEELDEITDGKTHSIKQKTTYYLFKPWTKKKKEKNNETCLNPELSSRSQ